MSKLITVIGVTGAQGSSVAATFLSLPGWRVRGVTRNPSSDKAVAAAAKGVEIVKGDVSDIESLKAAFTGANAVFAVTDYFSNMPQSEDALKAAADAGRSPPEFAGDGEVQQGLNMAYAAADPRVQTTLERFVFSSLPGVNTLSGGKYSRVYHFDSKAKIEDHIRKNIPEVATKMSVIHFGMYAENWKHIPFPIFAPAKQDDGSFVLYTAKEVDPSSQSIPYIIADKDGGPFVKALVLDHPAGIELIAASEFATLREYWKLWGEVVGKQATVRTISLDEWKNLVPDAMRVGVTEIFQYLKEFGYIASGTKIQTPEQAGIVAPTTSLREYFEAEDFSKIL